MLKVLFAGTPDVAVPSLRLLAGDAEHFEVVAVLTRPDAPTGRGRRLVPNPVKQAALELGLPVIESDPSEETFVTELAATGAQAAAVVAYGKILKCLTRFRWDGTTCISRCCRNGVAPRRCNVPSGLGRK